MSNTALKLDSRLPLKVLQLNKAKCFALYLLFKRIHLYFALLCEVLLASYYSYGLPNNPEVDLLHLQANKIAIESFWICADP